MSCVCIKHNSKLEESDLFPGLCSLCVEELAIQSAQNMGVPDHFWCGNCGLKCDYEEIVDHTSSKKCFIKLVKE